MARTSVFYEFNNKLFVSQRLLAKEMGLKEGLIKSRIHKQGGVDNILEQHYGIVKNTKANCIPFKIIKSN